MPYFFQHAYFFNMQVQIMHVEHIKTKASACWNQDNNCVVQHAFFVQAHRLKQDIKSACWKSCMLKWINNNAGWKKVHVEHEKTQAHLCVKMAENVYYILKMASFLSPFPNSSTQCVCGDSSCYLHVSVLPVYAQHTHVSSVIEYPFSVYISRILSFSGTFLCTCTYILVPHSEGLYFALLWVLQHECFTGNGIVEVSLPSRARNHLLFLTAKLCVDPLWPLCSTNF